MSYPECTEEWCAEHEPDNSATECTEEWCAEYEGK
jgi:hypothetical protein